MGIGQISKFLSEAKSLILKEIKALERAIEDEESEDYLNVDWTKIDNWHLAIDSLRGALEDIDRAEGSIVAARGWL